ncbi:hypothetical protein HD554DRAFT_2034358 [Boletus coccyginus]|nr:hypothetical protein HD554DRAFT_2034358 [Boletus coccyginus]
MPKDSSNNEKLVIQIHCPYEKGGNRLASGHSNAERSSAVCIDSPGHYSDQSLIISKEYCCFCGDFMGKKINICNNCGACICKQTAAYGRSCIYFGTVLLNAIFCCPICNAKYWCVQPSHLKASLPYSFLRSRGRKWAKLTWPLVLVNITLSMAIERFVQDLLKLEFKQQYHCWTITEPGVGIQLLLVDIKLKINRQAVILKEMELAGYNGQHGHGSKNGPSDGFKDLRGFVDRNEFNFVLAFGGCLMISHYTKGMISQVIKGVGIDNTGSLWESPSWLAGRELKQLQMNTMVLIYQEWSKEVKCRQIGLHQPLMRAWGVEFSTCKKEECRPTSYDFDIRDSDGRVHFTCRLCHWCSAVLRNSNLKRLVFRLSSSLSDMYWHDYPPFMKLKDTLDCQKMLQILKWQCHWGLILDIATSVPAKCRPCEGAVLAGLQSVNSQAGTHGSLEGELQCQYAAQLENVCDFSLNGSYWTEEHGGPTAGGSKCGNGGWEGQGGDLSLIACSAVCVPVNPLWLASERDSGAAELV